MSRAPRRETCRHKEKDQAEAEVRDKGVRDRAGEAAVAEWAEAGPWVREVIVSVLTAARLCPMSGECRVSR